jgi:hypothetical protein
LLIAIPFLLIALGSVTFLIVRDSLGAADPTPTLQPSAAAGASPTRQPPASAAASTGATAQSAAPSGRSTQAAPSSSPAPSTVRNWQTVDIGVVGLRLSIPADWKVVKRDLGLAQYASPDNRAQITIRWRPAALSSATACGMIRDELEATASVDPAFDSTAVRTETTTIGGMQGCSSGTYTYTYNGKRYSETDRATILPGKAQYFFGFLALDASFADYAPIFDDIIDTIAITGP